MVEHFATSVIFGTICGKKARNHGYEAQLKISCLERLLVGFRLVFGLVKSHLSPTSCDIVNCNP